MDQPSSGPSVATGRLMNGSLPTTRDLPYWLHPWAVRLEWVCIDLSSSYAFLCLDRLTHAFPWAVLPFAHVLFLPSYFGNSFPRSLLCFFIAFVVFLSHSLAVLVFLYWVYVP